MAVHPPIQPADAIDRHMYSTPLHVLPPEKAAIWLHRMKKAPVYYKNGKKKDDLTFQKKRNYFRRVKSSRGGSFIFCSQLIQDFFIH